GVVMGSWLLGAFSFDAAAAEAMRASASSEIAGNASVPTLGEWLIRLVPVNPVTAAADGAMLPLILFSVCFAAALTRGGDERRAAVLRVFEGIQDASLVLVRAILALAPIGVFARAVPLAAKLGIAAAG